MEGATRRSRNEICRICMQDDKNLYSIFEKVKFGDSTNTIAEIINECTKYAVASNDKLPPKICSICMTLAYSAHNFKRQAELAYCRLKALYDMSWKPAIEKGQHTSSVHRYTQTEKKDVYPCESCPRKFSTENNLQEHRSTAHAFDGKKCWVCGEKFNHWGQLKIHLSNKHPKEGFHCDFKCYVCQRAFGRKSHLKRHLVEVHKIQRPDCDLKCQICLEAFSRKDQLKRHLAQVHNFEDEALNIQNLFADESEMPLATDLSYEGEEYDDAEHFMSQNEMITATNQMDCDNQEQADHQYFNDTNEDIKPFADVLAQPEVLIKTENPDWEENDILQMKHKSDGDYVGNAQIVVGSNDECFELHAVESISDNYNNEISDDQESNQHEDANHLENGKGENKCGLWEEPSFSSTLPSKHKTHPQISSKRKENRCSECNRNFSRLAHLRRHMLTHNKQKTYKCNICSDSFRRYDQMQNHIQKKHGKKKLYCNQCSYGFERRDHLLLHIERRHSKPIIHCDMCEKTFTTKSSLERHKLLHTDRCDFKCHMCPKGYTRKDHLKRHLITIHGH